MDFLWLVAPVFLTLFILLLSDRWRYYYALAFQLVIAGYSTFLAIPVLTGAQPVALLAFPEGPEGTPVFTLDPLSAFFVILTNFTVITGFLYARGYLAPYRSRKSGTTMALHFFAYTWLYLSMLAVLTLREGTAFLIAWELMGLSSFLLILFEGELRTTLKTAVNYLVQMHIGLVLILAGFLMAENATGLFGFDGISLYFTTNPNLPLFLILFAGFAFKAGFIPFHTWLPLAHPAAPSHVSGVMSGVMIKMGIFGIFRLLISLDSQQTIIGIILLTVASVTGIFAILQASVQQDLKKMLAFSTIENVGIIGMGMGVGTIGLGTGNLPVTLLGFGGSLLHTLNHSFFKSLLFYGAGAVYHATHTRNMDLMGGLIKYMPRTATLFLAGSAAICALPPLNGFISEVIIYYGLFAGLQSGSFYITLLMMLGIIALALIGGLAIFSFTRTFGTVFLGIPRSSYPESFRNDRNGMVLPMSLILIPIFLIGMAPVWFIPRIMPYTGNLLGVDASSVAAPLGEALTRISIIGGVLVLIIIAILLIRKRAGIQRKTEEGPVWGCGYTAPGPKQQYTASSYAANITELAHPILRSSDEFAPVQEEEVFPTTRAFKRKTRDIIDSLLTTMAVFGNKALRNAARLQTGNIQHYILYAFIFMLFLFTLLALNLI